MGRCMYYSVEKVASIVEDVTLEDITPLDQQRHIEAVMKLLLVRCCSGVYVIAPSIMLKKHWSLCTLHGAVAAGASAPSMVLLQQAPPCIRHYGHPCAPTPLRLMLLRMQDHIDAVTEVALMHQHSRILGPY